MQNKVTHKIMIRRRSAENVSIWGVGVGGEWGGGGRGEGKRSCCFFLLKKKKEKKSGEGCGKQDLECDNEADDYDGWRCQNCHFCRDKSFVSTSILLSRQKTNFVATNM